jgi:small subunit ribosomal protein S1
MVNSMNSDSLNSNSIPEPTETTINTNQSIELIQKQDQLMPGDICEGIITRITEDAIIVDAGVSQEIIVSQKDISKLDDALKEKLSAGDKIILYIDSFSEGGYPIASISKGLKARDWANASKQVQSGEPIELKIIDQNRGGLIAAFGQLRGFVPNSQIPELNNNHKDQAIEVKRRLIGTSMPLLVIEADKKRNRLIFSAKMGRENPISSQIGDLKIGEKITGRVINLTKFGAFVDLGQGINGLIHISELSWQRISHPSEVVKIGDEITVTIKEIERSRERISLSLKALQPNPWDSIEERYTVGDLIEGMVTTVRDFGVFIQLAAGVEGLLHKSESADDGLITSLDSIKPGDKLLVRITSILTDQQRIGLSLQQVTLEEQITWMMHRQNDHQSVPNEETPQDFALDEFETNETDADINRNSSEETP